MVIIHRTLRGNKSHNNTNVLFFGKKTSRTIASSVHLPPCRGLSLVIISFECISFDLLSVAAAHCCLLFALLFNFSLYPPPFQPSPIYSCAFILLLLLLLSASLRERGGRAQWGVARTRDLWLHEDDGNGHQRSTDQKTVNSFASE